MSFREEYVKKELSIADLPLKIGDCGIAENLKKQWDHHEKAFGMFNDIQYIFGSEPRPARDHVEIVNEMEKIISDPVIIFDVTGETGRVSMYIHPAHSKPNDPTSFEIEIIREILKECKEALQDKPEHIGFSLTIDVDVFKPGNNLLGRSHNIQEIEMQIDALKDN